MAGLRPMGHSNNIPDYMINAIDTTEKKENVRTAQQKSQIDVLQYSKIRFADVSHQMIDHGKNTYEHAPTGSIWFKEGDMLIRASDDDSLMIKDYMERHGNGRKAQGGDDGSTWTDSVDQKDDEKADDEEDETNLDDEEQPKKKVEAQFDPFSGRYQAVKSIIESYNIPNSDIKEKIQAETFRLLDNEDMDPEMAVETVMKRYNMLPEKRDPSVTWRPALDGPDLNGGPDDDSEELDLADEDDPDAEAWSDMDLYREERRNREAKQHTKEHPGFKAVESKIEKHYAGKGKKNAGEIAKKIAGIAANKQKAKSKRAELEQEIFVKATALKNAGYSNEETIKHLSRNVKYAGVIDDIVNSAYEMESMTHVRGNDGSALINTRDAQYGALGKDGFQEGFHTGNYDQYLDSLNTEYDKFYSLPSGYQVGIIDNEMNDTYDMTVLHNGNAIDHKSNQTQIDVDSILGQLAANNPEPMRTYGPDEDGGEEVDVNPPEIFNDNDSEEYTDPIQNIKSKFNMPYKEPAIAKQREAQGLPEVLMSLLQGICPGCVSVVDVKEDKTCPMCGSILSDIDILDDEDDEDAGDEHEEHETKKKEHEEHESKSKEKKEDKSKSKDEDDPDEPDEDEEDDVEEEDDEEEDKEKWPFSTVEDEDDDKDEDEKPKSKKKESKPKDDDDEDESDDDDEDPDDEDIEDMFTSSDDEEKSKKKK